MNRVFYVLLLSFIFQGCTHREIDTFTGQGIGTFYKITYLGNKDSSLKNGVDSLLTDISTQFSIFDTASLISKLNRNEKAELSTDFIKVFNIAKGISELSEGAFDVTIAPLVDYWGFGKNISETGKSRKAVDSIMSMVDYRKVAIQSQQLVKDNKDITLNFNAIVKGYAVDKIATYLQGRGYANFLVEIGGEIVAKGMKNGRPWRIGIQTPTKTREGETACDYIFELKDQAVATSGNYLNYKEQNGIRYIHIVDPSTGYAEQTNLLSVTVIGSDCATADALATAFMVMGIQRSFAVLEKYPGYAAYFIYDDQGHFATTKSANFP